MKKPAILFLFIILLNNLSAQDCTCTTAVSTFISKTERNYAGFFDKVNARTKSKYTALKLSLKAKAKKTDANCFDIIYDYVRFFKDPHMILIENQVPPKNEISFKITEPLDKFSGFWYSRESEKRIYILRLNNKYQGYLITKSFGDSITGSPIFTISKKAGELEAEVYNEYYQKRKHKCTLTPNDLAIVYYESFSRIQLPPISPTDFKFTSYNDSITLLQFPSFSAQYKPVCDSLINANRIEIEKRKYLFVDIRNNAGGTILSFIKLLDYIYTNPTLYVSGINRVTEDNIKGAFENLESNKPYFDSSQYASEFNFLNSLKKTNNKFIAEHPDTLIRTVVYHYPEKVVFLVNSNTASAAEMLLLMALQNKKTIIAGINTSGAVDYTEPQFHFTCNNKYVLGIPWIKRSRSIYNRDIDNIGISPKINLSKLPEERWLNYLMENLSQ